MAAIVESTDDAIVAKSLDGVIQSWNRGAERIFGYSAAEVLGRHITLLFPHDRVQEEDAILERIGRGERIEHYETVRLTKEGRPIHVSLTVSPICDPEGRVVGASSIKRDITDRKRADERLAEARSQLAAELDKMARLQEVSTRLIQQGDLRLLLHEMLVAATELTGADKGEIRLLDDEAGTFMPAAQVGLPRRVLDSMDPLPAALRASCERAAQEGGRVLVEDLADGSPFGDGRIAGVLLDSGIRALRATPLVARSGVLLGVMCTLYPHPHRMSDSEQRIIDLLVRQAADLVERTVSEQAISESELRFRALADNIPQLAWMADRNGWIFWFNKRWFEYTGETHERMKGWGWMAVHHPEHVDPVVTKFRRHIESGEVFEEVFPLRGGDGRYRWFLTRAVPIRDDGGTIHRWFGTNTDITERMEMEAELKESDRKKDEFLAMLGHELRNPLGAILNGIEVLERRHAPDPRTQRLHEIISRQARHIGRLVDDLLDVSRVSRGKINLRRERLDLNELVRGVVDDYRLTLEAGHRTVEVQLAPVPVWVSVDSARIAQVISNLLHNAQKFTSEGAEITISVERDQQSGEATVTVRDTGVGMSPELLSTVFEPFTQSTSTTAGGGLGLGLALVKGLVELHGGSVHADSAGEGRGSEFSFSLPVVAPGERRAVEPPAPEERHRIRVMVVEDEPDIAEMFSLLLEGLGHEVEVADGGAAVLARLAEFRPDIVFSDIGMPGMDGYELVRRIRARSPHPPPRVVALTGYGQRSDRQRALDAGFDEHLAKPVSAERLRTVLARVRAPHERRPDATG